MRLSCVVFFALLSFFGYSQNEDIVYDNYVYVPYIKSVDFGLGSAELSKPIINLNSSAQLILRFDDTSADTRDYVYDIIHCDRNWEPSELDNMEYIDGFTMEELDSVEFSINTYMDYTHYALSLPNDDLKWTISGNYILVVYEESGNETFPILTQRFMVVDKQVQVTSQYLRPSDVSKYDTHQEFDFEVDFKNIDLQDPMTTITGVVLQNYRWDNAIFGLKPKFINREKLVFDYNDHIVFPALKEYRSLDIRSLRSTGIGVNTIELNQESNDVLLELQESRRTKRYLSRNDANGDFVMYSNDSKFPYIGADYANVIFILKSPKLEDEVYVLGGFNNYQPSDEVRMSYSSQREAYVTEIKFKQGYYDYMFGVWDSEKEVMDLDWMQGSYYETENDYLILIYYSTRYERYDQLIGISVLNSNEF